ncbi:hypothetical protein [Streptomyces sp. NPDC048272]|uniref:hypothetical protein n=1 Tax=Streptomyces sp. NPDC048272 TaxID=3154616 RepID=UPI0034155CDD
MTSHPTPDALRRSHREAVVAYFEVVDAEDQDVDTGDLTETIAGDVKRLLEGRRRPV